MAGDRAKNTLHQARSVNLSATNSRFKDFVGKADPNDLYHFTLNGRSSFNLNLANLRKGTNVDVELFSFKGDAKSTLKRFGKIDFSKLSRQTIRQSFTVLGRSIPVGKQEALSLAIDSGDYYLRVYSRKGDTNYSLTLAASAVPVLSPTPLPTPTPNPTPSPFPPPSPTPTPTPTPNLDAGFTPYWIRQIGGAGNDYAYGTVSDNASNIYVSGVTPRSGTDATNAFVAKYDSIGTQLWFRSFDVSNSSSASNIAFDVAVDTVGNYYVTGATNITSTSADGFVAKYNSSGDQLWQQLVQSTSGIFPAGDAASSIALSESASGAVSVYISGLTKAIPTLNPGQAFVAKYNTNLGTTAATTSVNRSWLVDSQTQNWFAGSSSTSGAADLAIDSSGDLYIAGITSATLQSDITHPFAGGDAFLIKLSSSGAIQRPAVTLSSMGSGGEQDYARGVAVDRSGNVYITGQTDGALIGQVSAGDRDAFVAKYDTNLNRLWVNQVGTSSLDEGQAIALDAAGNVYAAGETNGSLFGTGLGGSDAWIAKFNGAGTRLNSKQLGTNRDDESYGITIDNTGKISLSGQTQGTFPNASPNQGGYDVWVENLLQP